MYVLQRANMYAMQRVVAMCCTAVVAVCCSVLHSVAVCCSLLQCAVAVCCSALLQCAQCAAVLPCIDAPVSAAQHYNITLQKYATHCNHALRSSLQHHTATHTQKLVRRNFQWHVHVVALFVRDECVYLLALIANDICPHSACSIAVVVRVAVIVSSEVAYSLAIMGWLSFVGPLKIQVSFAKEPYKRDLYSATRPMFLRSLLIVATPYCERHVLRGGYG